MYRHQRVTTDSLRRPVHQEPEASRTQRITGTTVNYQRTQCSMTDGRYPKKTRDHRENPGGNGKHRRLTALNNSEGTDRCGFYANAHTSEGRTDSKVASQMMKERYRQELLEQIAEQQQKKTSKLWLNDTAMGLHDRVTKQDQTRCLRGEDKCRGKKSLEYSTQSRVDASLSPDIQRLPLHTSRSNQENAKKYRMELMQQIQERERHLKLEKEEEQRHEAQLTEHNNKYQPWGRGGCGAPLRDSKGNLITNLTLMHRQNMAAYNNPDLRERRATAVLTAPQMEPLNPDIIMSDVKQSPEFVLGDDMDHHPKQQETRGDARVKEGPEMTEERCKKEERIKDKEVERQRPVDKMEEKRRREEGERLRNKKKKRLTEKRAHVCQEHLVEQGKEPKKLMIQERQRQRTLKKEEVRRHEAQPIEHNNTYQPWGRSGCGAPLRDSKGNLITNLTLMHRQNMAAHNNPDLREKRTTAVLTAPQMEPLNPDNIMSDVKQSPEIPPDDMVHHPKQRETRANRNVNSKLKKQA